MPTTAQDRVRRGPFGALLILLSLVLGSSAASAGTDLRDSPARLGASRPAAAAALLPAANRHGPDDDVPARGGGPSVPPSAPAVVTELLSATPQAGPASGDRIALPPPAAASYRARAPPAS